MAKENRALGMAREAGRMIVVTGGRGVIGVSRWVVHRVQEARAARQERAGSASAGTSGVQGQSPPAATTAPAGSAVLAEAREREQQHGSAPASPAEQRAPEPIASPSQPDAESAAGQSIAAALDQAGGTEAREEEPEAPAGPATDFAVDAWQPDNADLHPPDAGNGKGASGHATGNGPRPA